MQCGLPTNNLLALTIIHQFPHIVIVNFHISQVSDPSYSVIQTIEKLAFQHVCNPVDTIPTT